jgi:hypothetical protein
MRAYLGLILFLAAPAAGQADFKKALKAYEAGMKRPAIGKRTNVIDKFARTRDARALKLLFKQYDKPKLPKEFERYIVAQAIGRHFSAPPFASDKAAFLRHHDKAEHAWLWFQLGRSTPSTPPTQDLFLRSALLQARRGLTDPAKIPALVDLEKPTSLEAILLPEAAASILLGQRLRIRTPEFQQAALALINHLHEKKPTPARTRLVIARHFAALLDAPKVSTRSVYWRQLLSYEDVREQSGPTGEGKPRFFGVEATGDRIAFLIDLSDSMLEPLTAQERADADALPKGTESKDKQIDWKKIKTRFDLARLFLSQYLKALPAGKRFTVIGFGDHARSFKSTKGLVKVTRGSVGTTIRELNKIKATSKTKLHPHGQLWGATNIHGAFLLAFNKTSAKNLDDPSFVQAKGLTKGCDTIFLLSDGKPTKDNFQTSDEFKGGRLTVNSETGETKASSAGSALFNGPYIRWEYLLDDVRRMNLFRKAEIHTVAMGSADEKLMRGLADAGLGRYRSVGVRAKGGRIAHWMVAKPFPAPDPKKWSEPAAPEKVLKEGFRKPAVYKVGEDKWVGWSSMRGDWKHGALSVNSKKESCAYAYAVVIPDQPGAVELKVGAREGVRVWLNGELVLDNLEPEKKFKRDAHTIKVTLKAGKNPILVKVCQRKGWGRFHARLLDEKGKPLSFRAP